VITTIGAFVLLTLFFVFEGRVRQGQAAKSLEAGEHDRRSTAYIAAAFGLGRLSLRLWAPRVLGQFYTRTLRVAELQTVVDQGPYQLIRHPGYAGDLALRIVAGLATDNLPITLVIAAVMFAAYSYRIQVEEQMLVATLGQPYRDYQARTRRLIPFVY
jgi:protein-S-isoprenylcysteine O-methyltransferase Ste14